MKKSTVVLIIVCVVCLLVGTITAIAASVKATELGIKFASENAEGCYEWFSDDGNWTWTCDETYTSSDSGDVNVNLPGIQVHVDDDKVNVNLPGIQVNVADGTAVVSESDATSVTTSEAD